MDYTNYNILLNFLPLKEQEFEFTIYRKECKGEKKIHVGDNIYLNTLPINLEDLNDRKNYWISFDPKNDFEEFLCKPIYNNKLTLHFLYHCLLNKTKNQLEINQFIIPQKVFKKLIYFILHAHEEGKECILLSPFYLPSQQKFGFLIDFKFLKEKEIQFNRKVQQLSLSLDKNFKSNSNFYIDKYEKLELFKNNFYSKIFPLKIGNKQINLEDSFISIPASTLKTKIYLFGNSKESNSQFTGIKEYGPFESLKNTPIKFLFFYKNEHKQFASDLAKALNGDMFPTFSGFKQFFKVSDIEIKGIEIEDYTSVLDIINNNYSNENFIPIIILPRNEEDKYYTIKHNILKNYNRASQFITLELLKIKESLKWSVSNIALQIFAKLGGIPWMVKPETHKTLIIGIGQSHKLQIKDGKTEITKYFAYSVLTDSSGRYKELKPIGAFNDKDEYLNNLSRHIEDTIQNYSNDFENFVIHCPFKIRKFELEKIKETLKNINNSKTFVVIKINSENKFFGFNKQSNSLVPYESAYLELSTNEFLIWFEGLQYHNPNINKRIPGPTHVEFYYSNKELTQKEKKSFLQDIINLSGANWRGFNSKSTPISIHYTRLVSKFIQHFSEYEEVNIENIKPWFL